MASTIDDKLNKIQKNKKNVSHLKKYFDTCLKVSLSPELIPSFHKCKYSSGQIMFMSAVTSLNTKIFSDNSTHNPQKNKKKTRVLKKKKKILQNEKLW